MTTDRSDASTRNLAIVKTSLAYRRNIHFDLFIGRLILQLNVPRLGQVSTLILEAGNVINEREYMHTILSNFWPALT